MTAENRQLTKCIITDYIAVTIAVLLFNIARYEWFVNSQDFASLSWFLSNRTIILGQIVFPLMMIGIYYLSGAYYNVLMRSRLDDIVNTIFTNAIGSVLIYFTILIDDIVDDKSEFYTMLGTLWLLLTLLVGSERLLLTTLLMRSMRSHKLGYNTLIIGVSQAAVEMVGRINSAPKTNGLKIIGYVDPCGDNQLPRNLDLPVYDILNLGEIIREKNVLKLIVMPHRDGLHATMRLINSLFPYGRSILVSPLLLRVISGKTTFDDIKGEPLVDVSQPHISPSTASCKRAADLVLSILALAVLSPLLLTIALAIKIKSPKGGVLYFQERVGYRKKKFNIIKFRTMCPDAEENGPALSSPDDPRITPIGHFLRKYRLDELPQFWNVIRGEMSIVGPRPEREYYISRIVKEVPYYSMIHNVRPGITSWGMVKYGYATTVEQMIDRLQYDLVYIENISLGVDMKIILYTVKTVFKGRGV